ncbi:transcription repressor OFP14-like [Salvia hispanica]|uniref:transcription repressor OFP14-like n=1 Tax=Salvia hispanica TaxID=49212 RepID=UPI002009841F|nr:transcription repressor OFP14-like [Salvia hispanica]
MSSPFPKSLKNYFSKITSPSKQSPLRRRKSPSITAGDGGDLSDVDKSLFEDFGSLYREEYEEGSSLPLNSPRPLRGSGRFFVETGSSRSSRITDDTFSSSAASSTSEEQAGGDLAAEDFLVLHMEAPDPYDAFRQSMLEMVEARIDLNRSVDWKFLEELLFCYFDMNKKKSRRHILRAFVDVVVFLRQISGDSQESLPPVDDGELDEEM